MTTTSDKKAAERKISHVKPDNFILVQGWMLTDLHLSRNDLLVYAIIHGFSQDGESCFHGSLQYLADWTGSTKKGIQKNLKNLIAKGFITKSEKVVNGVKYCEYVSTDRKTGGYGTEFPGMEHCSPGMEHCSPGMELSSPGMEHCPPNNIDNNKANNKKESTGTYEPDDDDLPFEEKESKPRTFDGSLRAIMDAWNEMTISLRETRGIKRPAVHRVTPGTPKYASVCNVLKAYTEDQIIACIKAVPRVEHWINPTSKRIVESGWKLNFNWFFEKFWDVVLPQMELMDVLVPVRAGSDITYKVNDIPAVQTQQTQQIPQAQTQQAKAEPVMVGGFAFPE